jgi:YggT family protein
MKAILDVLLVILNVASWIIIIQAVLSWLITFRVLDLRNDIVAQIWGGLQRMTEPLYRPIRRMLPEMSGLDLTPMVVLLLIFLLQRTIAYYVYPNVF